jgi:hypothetical protein
MVFTQVGVSEFNNLADEDIFQVEETFAHVSFIPEPSAAALGTAAITALGLIRLASRRRRRSAAVPRDRGRSEHRRSESRSA